MWPTCAPRLSAAVVLLLEITAVGCRLTDPAASSFSRLPEAVQPSDAQASPAGPRNEIEQVAFHHPGWSAGVVYAEDDPFAGQTELALSQLVEEVLARNPSLQATIAAWRGAAQRYPQVISLEDPMFGFMLGPGSWGDPSVESAYLVEASQKLPWPGKRQLRGQVALSEASAARFDIGNQRLMLEEAAHLSFFDYYLAHRELELNHENLSIMQEFRNAADAKYKASLVTQQDVLQSDVEIAELQRRRIELERMNDVAVARINTLLHREADFPLPPPPTRLALPDALQPAEVLREVAMQRRPDLAALGARIRAEQANVALAAREFYPDFEIVGRYDAFWQEHPLRTSVGMNLNVPLWKQRRRAAFREALLRVRQLRAEFEAQIDNIQNDVQSTYARFLESRKVNDLYQNKLTPVAKLNVASARSGYENANLDFLRLIEAQRQLIMIQEKAYEAETDCHRRLAELRRQVGGPLPSMTDLEEVPAVE